MDTGWTKRGRNTKGGRNGNVDGMSFNPERTQQSTLKTEVYLIVKINQVIYF